MSKFVDKLQRLYRSSAPAIGFRTASSVSSGSPLLLISSLAAVGIEEAKAVANNGADAGIVSYKGLNARNFKQSVKAIGDIPLGIFMESVGLDKVDELVSSGCDFVIFDAGASAAMLQKKEVGRILKVKPSLDVGLIRAIGDLQPSIDGVLISEEGAESFVSIERLLVCQRFAQLLDKPLLVTLPLSVSADELGSFLEAGVVGVIVPAEESAGKLAQLREIVDNLPRRAKRESKRGVFLPQLGGDSGIEAEEEEEE